MQNGYCNGESCAPYYHCAECSSLMRCVDRYAYEAREKFGISTEFIPPKAEKTKEV